MSERTTSEKSASRISGKSISQNVKNASYAVRGPIVSRSMEISNALKTQERGSSKYPFERVISCNIGNPHALGQGSISFVRDVLSMVVNPSLLSASLFTTDAVERAKKYLSSAQCVGAYSESQGFLSVREEVSEFLERRDGYPSDPNDIFLTNGASEGVRFCMQTIIRDPSSGYRDGVLTPIPQYPLYSALTTLLQGHLVPYLLDESTGWSCTSVQLSDALVKADVDGICVRALVVINPGNPTGQILSEGNMIDIVRFCMENHICLMADEVYQENVWRKGSQFLSFRKVAMDLKAFDGPEPLQLVSFHSVSKVTHLRYLFFENFFFPNLFSKFPRHFRASLENVAFVAATMSF
jgi:aspartate/methionine/tyrosine aminotransferase